jgi:predicted RNA-binding protein with PUA-like domain
MDSLYVKLLFFLVFPTHARFIRYTNLMAPSTPRASHVSRPSRANYWLIKSEPETYGIDHLKADKKTAWTGVRNFQARNFMQTMKIGDPVLFYHSSCKVPGVYGIATVASAPYPDPTQFDASSHYYEPRATTQKPVWYLVDVAFVRKLEEPIRLPQIRDTPRKQAFRYASD